MGKTTEPVDEVLVGRTVKNNGKKENNGSALVRILSELGTGAGKPHWGKGARAG